MLNFSEGAASATDIEALANFDSDYDRDAYGAKIARLLRRAYQHDAKLGQTHQWQDALNALGSWESLLNENLPVLDISLRLTGISGQ